MAFTNVQNGVTITANVTGNVTTLTLPLPVASTAGTLLVACVVTGQAGIPFKMTAVATATGSNPNTSPGWEWCCTSVNGSGQGGQQVEIWCYRQNPGGITSATWVLPTNQGARGHVMEFSTTLAWQVMELFPGLNTAVNAGATSFPVSMATPVGSGELAVAMFGDNFGSVGTLVNWTTPTGWTAARNTTGLTIGMHWASYYKTTASAGTVSVTGVTSTATGQIGWEAAVVVFKETAAVRALVGASCSAGSYTDQASFGFSHTKTGSAKEFDFFVGRTMAQAAQVSYQKEGAHLTTGPTGDINELTAMGAQIVWSLKPNRTGATGFTTVAAEQAAVDQDVTLVKQAGVTGFICCLYNEYNLGGANGPFGNDTNNPTGDPYGTGNTDATAKKHFQTYWANYQPTLAAHGIPVMTKPSMSSAASVASWHPPAGTVSGVLVDLYYSDSGPKGNYLDTRNGTDPATGNPPPSIQDVCDGVRNPDNSAASNAPIPLGIGEAGRSGSGALTPGWSTVVAWSHTGGGTGHLRDFFTARIAAGKQCAPILWFENNLGGGNWIHTPGVNGEDQTGIQAELAAWVDNLSPAAAAPGTTVTVTTTTLPNGALGVAYSQALTVTGGASPYTWALATGALPTGLSLSAAGVISGTPSAAGTFTFTVTATDAGANSGTSGTLSIFVPGMAITTTTLPGASYGAAYSVTLTETGGTGPFTWALVAGSGDLPDGLTLSPAGVLSGTVAGTFGSYPFSVTVTDSLGNTATASFTLNVSAGGTGGGVPAQLPPAYPQLIIEAGFYSRSPVAPPGTLILDDPVNGQLDSGTLGDGTAWTDITPYVRSGTVTRTSTRVQGPLLTYQAGTASVVLKNADARFDPDNGAGPYVTGGVSAVRPMVPVRARAIYAGTEYHLFSGFIDTWSTPGTNWGPNYSEITASATDGFKILAGITLPAVPAFGAGETSGTRISRILTNASWYTDHRRIDAGNSALQATGYGDTALNLLQLTADSEIGELYIDGSGNVVFRHRLAAVSDARSTTPQAVFGDAPGTARGGLTGMFLNPATMGEPSYAQAVADWTAWSGAPLGVTRQYFGLSTFPTVDTSLSYCAANGVKCCIDLRPAYNPVSATDLANLGAMLAFWQAAGLQAEVSLHHEPVNAGLSSAQYIAMVQYYGPTVRQYYPLVFNTSAYTVQTASENTYYPGDAYIDKITTDFYATRWLGGTTLDLPASIADNAVPPKPFGLWEFGAAPKGSNLLIGDNAGFEATSGTWTGAGNATAAQTTAAAHAGTGSLAVTSLAAGTMTAAHCTAANITTQGLPCSPGDQIACTAWALAATVSRQVQTGANFYTSGGTFISSSFSGTAADATGAWTQVTDTVTAPATAAFCRLAVQFLSTAAASEVHYLDDATLGNLNTGQSQANVTAFYNYVQSFFTARVTGGKPVTDLIQFGSGSASGFNATIVTPILGPSDYRIPLWQSLRAALLPYSGAQLPYLAVGRANDDTTLANDVQITNAGSANMQEAKNAKSIAKYLFPRSYARTDILLQSDFDAAGYAQWVLYVSLAGEDRFDTLTVSPLRDPRLWQHVLGREIGDRITVIRTPPGMGTITKDVFIRGISHTIDAASNTWQTTWDLQDASRYTGFLVLDDPVLGKLSTGLKAAY